MYNILICVKQISYPYTEEHIYNTIQDKLKILGLEKKINITIIDNESNIIKAIRKWNSVDYIACFAHILQLCILKGLKQINHISTNTLN